MNDEKLHPASGKSVGDPDGLGSFFVESPGLNDGTKGAANVRVVFNTPVLLRSYDWTTTLSEIYLDLTTIDEFRFSCLFHFVVDTPVAAAQDHPKWNDDVTLVFSFYTNSGAFITSVTYMFRRGCGRYLHEVPAQQFASQVAWPIKNLGSQKGSVVLGGTFRLRVTAC